MLNWSFKLFRVYGIRLEIHISFILLLMFFGYEGWGHAGIEGVLWGVFFLISIFTCVALHELGHSLMALRFGIRVRRILLLPIGGMAQFDSIPKNPWKELAITVAGPAVNFALAAFFFFIFRPGSVTLMIGLPLDVHSLGNAMIVSNLVMGVFNLIPVFPMDGGRIFRAVLAMKFSYLNATKWASGVGKVLAVLAAGYALMHGSYPIALLFAFIFVGGDMEYRYVKQKEVLVGVCVSDLIQRDFCLVEGGTSIECVSEKLENENSPYLVIIDEGQILDVLSVKTFQKFQKKRSNTDSVADLCERSISSLQAEWPLEPFYSTLIASERRTFPVFSFGRLVGIIDVREMDRSIETIYERKKLTKKKNTSPERSV
jgi:Zn-dependent protease